MDPILIGVSPAMEKIKKLIKSVARSGVNVVITGESGVGKEIVAQRLYLSSPRKGKPFVKINCAALPEALLESELFGYDQGGFTGTSKNRRGFLLAHESVLFLDQISELSLVHQSKMVRSLHERAQSPREGENEVMTHTWIIAATNKPLDEMVEEKTFRQDLYYRLNVINIDIPPLRERPEDIPALVVHYLDAFTVRFKMQTQIRPPGWVMDKFVAYHWPGNVRELQNMLQRYLVMHNWEEILDEISGKPDPVPPPKPAPLRVSLFSAARSH